MTAEGEEAHPNRRVDVGDERRRSRAELLGQIDLVAVDPDLSPSTLLDTQLRVDFGALKKSGLTSIQTSASVTGISHQRPIQSRLQIASDNRDSAAIGSRRSPRSRAASSRHRRDRTFATLRSLVDDDAPERAVLLLPGTALGCGFISLAPVSLIPQRSLISLKT